jgi:hypothetical protein
VSLQVILLYGLVGSLLGCENTRIYAGAQLSMSSPSPEKKTLGVCEESQDCPQWSCIRVKCVQRECIPERKIGRWTDLTPLSAEGRGDRVTSVNLFKDGLYLSSVDSNDEETAQTASSISKYIRDEGSWVAEDHINRPDVRSVFGISGDGLITIEGEDSTTLTILNWRAAMRGGEAATGISTALSAPAQSVVVDDDLLWVGVFQKGVELIDLSSLDTDETHPRFNTPGRALATRAGRSYIVVADGFAGLSIFLKRADSGLEIISPARKLVTPPQEVPTSGRVVDLDLLEGRVVSAEWGAGIGLSVIDPELGVQRQWVTAIDGEVSGVRFVDPYTALAWIKGKGVMSLDLLDPRGPQLLEFLSLADLPAESSSTEMSMMDAPSTRLTPTTAARWTSWSSLEGRVVGIGVDGVAQSSEYLCD